MESVKIVSAAVPVYVFLWGAEPDRRAVFHGAPALQRAAGPAAGSQRVGVLPVSVSDFLRSLCGGAAGLLPGGAGLSKA